MDTFNAPIKNYIVAFVNYQRTQILIDTGASKSCVSEAFLKRIHAFRDVESVPSTAPTYLVAANGNELSVCGVVNLKLCIEGLVITHEFLVLKGLSHRIILGMTFLKQCEADVNIAKTHLSLYDDLVVTPLVTYCDELNILRLVTTVKLSPFTEAIVPVRYKARNLPRLTMTEPYPGLKTKLIGVARCLVKPQNHRTVCRVLNLSDKPRYIRQGTVLAYLLPVDENDEYNKRVLNKTACMKQDHNQYAAPLMDNVKSQLTHDQKLKELQDRGL